MSGSQTSSWSFLHTCCEPVFPPQEMQLFPSSCSHQKPGVIIDSSFLSHPTSYLSGNSVGSVFEMYPEHEPSQHLLYSHHNHDFFLEATSSFLPAPSLVLLKSTHTTAEWAFKICHLMSPLCSKFSNNPHLIESKKTVLTMTYKAFHDLAPKTFLISSPSTLPGLTPLQPHASFLFLRHSRNAPDLGILY